MAAIHVAYAVLFITQWAFHIVMYIMFHVSGSVRNYLELFCWHVHEFHWQYDAQVYQPKYFRFLDAAATVIWDYTNKFMKKVQHIHAHLCDTSRFSARYHCWCGIDLILPPTTYYELGPDFNHN